MRPLALFSVLATVACGITAVGCGDVEPRQTATLGPLRFSHPASFDRRYPSCKYMVTGVRELCLSGVVVASFALGPHPEVPSAMASPSGVSFRLHPASDQKPVVVAPPVRFPLSLADFNPRSRCFTRRQPCPPAEQHELFFRVTGKNYWAIAWVGRHSSEHLRAELASIISSLRAK